MDMNNYESFNIHDIDYMNNNHQMENDLDVQDECFFDAESQRNAIDDVRNSHRPTYVDLWPNSNISVLPSEDENENISEYIKDDANNLEQVCLEDQGRREISNSNISNKVDQLQNAQLIRYGISANNNLQIKKVNRF